MPNAEATAAYPGYARERKKREANARRYKPGASPILRAFAFLVRVILAALLLPLDLLLGDALRKGDWTRPTMGIMGGTTAWFAFQAAEWAMGMRHHNSLGAHHKGNDDAMTKHLGKFLKPKIPASIDLCRLRGVPGTAFACAPAGVKSVIAEMEMGSVLQSEDNTKLPLVDVVDLVDGSRALRINNEIRASFDLRSGTVTSPPATIEICTQALKWQPQFAIGSRSVRILLIGGSGGNIAAYGSLKKQCVERSTKRHRRGSEGGAFCSVTLMERSADLVNVLQRGFGDSLDSNPGQQQSVSEKTKGDGSSNKNVFRIVAGDAISFLEKVNPGSLDVVVFDERRIDEILDASSSASSSDCLFTEGTRTESVYYDTKRALRAGGVLISVAVAPSFGPGFGSEDLSLVKVTMRNVFGSEKKAVSVEKTGPALPAFAQQVLVIGTKTVDPKLAAHFNYN